ncbi:MAG: glucose-6-phosphate dehydrogenase [Candidatus Rifleibacteriota bacterium]
MTKIFCASSIVIFGGTGDLATKKLIPALCRLQSADLLIKDFHIFVTGRSPLTTQEFIDRFSAKQEESLASDETYQKGFDSLKSKIKYIQADPTMPDESKNFMNKLKKLEHSNAPAKLFYLAVPPGSMGKFIELIKPFTLANQNKACPVRVLIEKPFGSNLKTAKELNRQLLEVFDEDQIFRIDHYLGKEAVQNILFMRFANIFFEPVWNNKFVDNVQITFAEKIGIDSRAAYFDKIGILRDVVQNHLLQVLCLVALEPPLSNETCNLYFEKNKVLKALRKIKPEQVTTETVRAQYTGNIIEKNKINGYFEEEDIPGDSTTETYAACRLFIDNWRWSGVPFYLRAGKRLAKKTTEICVNFKTLPHSIFKDIEAEIAGNRLIIKIQPDEGITLKVNSKPPGMEPSLKDVDLHFSYESEFGSYRPDAYERLLLDALRGNSALFLRNSEIEESWKFIDPIIESWQSNNSQPVYKYKAGTMGPSQADELLARHGHKWY